MKSKKSILTRRKFFKNTGIAAFGLSLGTNKSWGVPAYIPNLLKPNSTLPEQEDEDIGIVFDYTIKSQWRDEFEEEAKSEVNSGNIKTLDELCEFYLGWVGDKIVLENGITTEMYEEIEKN